MELEEFVRAFAHGLEVADARAPIAVNARTGFTYQPGIGPHSETQTIKLVLAAVDPVQFRHRFEVPYPAAPRARCDVVLDSPEPWAIEIKMLRLMGDNGRPNDNMLMHILSPYLVHRSALTDFVKLRDSGLVGRKAIVVFGYDYAGLPVDTAIEALELLASRQVKLGGRATARFGRLVHPVHQSGQVVGWEIKG
jgi:hypothetical protein